MKSLIKISLLLLLIISNLTLTAFAGNVAVPIVIDGNFGDWYDKPYIVDPKHDIKTPASDITRLGFIADEEFLYLSVERLAAKKSEPWNLGIIIINGLEGEVQFDIEASYDASNSKDEMLVSVALNGENLESTFSGSTNGKNIEFGIPLKEAGLNGKNKSIIFTVKSEGDRKEIDWVPDGKTIVVTTGPSLWSFAYVILFGFVFFVFKNKYSTGFNLSVYIY